MTSRFEPIGDDPRLVAAQSQQWRQLARRMGDVALQVAAQAGAVASAWPEGGAAGLALGEARRCGDDAGEAAHAYARAAAVLDGLVEPLTRWGRQVAELDEAWQLLAHAQHQVRVAAGADLGDPHSQARLVLAQRQLDLVRARTGHADTASVEAAYEALRRDAKGQVDDVAGRLERLVAQGAAAVPGTGAGRSGVSRFRTELVLLADGARAQGRLAPQLARLVDDGVLPPEAAGWDPASLAAFVQDHPQVAEQLVARRPLAGAGGLVDALVVRGGDPGVPGEPMPLVSFETFLATLGPAPTPSLGSVGDPGWPRRLVVREAFESLTPSEQQLAALLWPGLVGNLSGAPFAARATANHVRVVAAVREQERRDAGRARDAWDAGTPGEGRGPRPVYDWEQVQRDRAHAAELRTLAADPARQVVWFDNSGDGSIVELHGALAPETVGVGIFVPGTGAELGGHETNARRSQSWVDASRGRVAMVTWMAGDLPDSVVRDAPFRDYADRLGPALASFSHDLRQEVDRSAAARTDVDAGGRRRTGPAVTVIGHSYGGAVVGTGEQFGLDADNVIHLESAGAGHDVHDVDDLRPGRCDTRRYAITAANDPIRLIQGVPDESARGPWDVLTPSVLSESTKDLGHGADPVTLTRVEQLTGDHAADGHLLEPWEAHSGVLDEGAEGWVNVLDVLNGLPPTQQEARPFGPLGYAS